MTHALESFMEHHARLNALFQAHQEALVGLEIARAQEALAAYRAALLEHMAFEEKQILPIYEKLPRIRGSGVEFFTGEHEKIRALLDAVRAIVEPLRADDPGVRARVVAAFDRSAVLKSLLEHHDLREGQLLYPRLAETLTPDEARALNQACPVPPEPGARG